MYTSIHSYALQRSLFNVSLIIHAALAIGCLTQKEALDPQNESRLKRTRSRSPKREREPSNVKRPNAGPCLSKAFKLTTIEKSSLITM